MFNQDLESRVSEQNSVLAEMERRTEIYRKEAETARKWTSSIGAINFGKVGKHFKYILICALSYLLSILKNLPIELFI